MRSILLVIITVFLNVNVYIGQTVQFKSLLIEPTLEDVYVSASKVSYDQFKGIVVEDEKEVVIISNAIKNELNDVEPFLGISIKARYQGSENVIKGIFVRTYDDQNNIIEEWKEIEKLDLTDRQAGLYITDLLFVSKETRYIQYKIILNPDNSESSIKNLEISFISPGATAEEELERYLIESQDQNATDGNGDINQLASYPRPSYVARTSWGASLGLSNTNSYKVTTTVTHLVLHHSAGQTYSSDYAAVVRSYYVYHTNSLGWSDIGYNWLVDPNGVLYQGASWKSSTEENVIGAHNSGYNSNTSGLSMIGDYETYQPTQVSLDKMAQIMAFLCSKFNLNPTATTYFAPKGQMIPVITGHRDNGGGTTCPGKNLISRYDWFRNTVKNLLAGQNNNTPVTLLSPANNSTNVSLTPTLSWQALSGASSYNVQVSTNSSFSSNILVNNNVSSTSYTVPYGILSNNVKYYWRVKANNSTAYSAVWSFTTIAQSSTQPFVVMWERSAAKGTMPAWFSTNSAERGLAFHSASNLLLVVSRSNNATKVRTINATTGADVGELNVSGISGGYFALNDIETTWDGSILACNMTLNASTDPFKIYRWSSVSSSPTVFITYNAKNYRLGDNFVVFGNLTSNAAIYVGAANTNKVLRWIVSNGVLQSQTPTEISLSNLNLQTVPSIAPFGTGSSSDFYVNSTGISPTLFASNGTNKGTINSQVIPIASTAIKTFVVGSQRFLLTFQTDNTSGNPNGQNVRIVDVTNGPSGINASHVYGVTPRLGNNSNPNNTGDIAYTFANNSYIIFVLATNNGIGAYRCSKAPLFKGDSFTSMEESVWEDNISPEQYELYQNYPNPFNPNTTIAFYLPNDEYVKINVYNTLGELIATLADSRFSRGLHKVDFDAKNLSSGVYIYTLKAGEFFKTRKMILAK